MTVYSSVLTFTTFRHR